MAVAGAISSGLDIRCVTMMGVVRHRPSPIPAMAWYPIHTLDPEWVCKVVNIPPATVVRIDPIIRNGLKSPTAPTVTPIMICVRARHMVSTLDLNRQGSNNVLLKDSLKVRTNGIVLTPEAVALTPLTA